MELRHALRTPLVFLFLAGCLGMLLRWYFVSPIEGFIYPFWLHAHSHIMFLGWVVNALLAGYVHSYDLKYDRYKLLYGLIQLCMIGMLIAFPIQGYAPVSIVISVLHTGAVVVFGIRVMRELPTQNTSPSALFVRMSVILFFVSSVGPFALGGIMATGLGHTNWYYFAVYYYLHFQYNGVFVFGALALGLKMIEDRRVSCDAENIRLAAWVLFISQFPAYLLSVLWANPGTLWNIIAAIGGVGQLVSLVLFAKAFRAGALTEFSSSGRWLLILGIASLSLKFILQFISAHSEISQLAYENRGFVIGYIHLAVIGAITLPLLAWYQEEVFKVKRNWWLYILLVAGLVLSECLIVAGSVRMAGFTIPHYAAWLFIVSLLMLISFAGIALIRFKSVESG